MGRSDADQVAREYYEYRKRKEQQRLRRLAQQGGTAEKAVRDQAGEAVKAQAQAVRTKAEDALETAERAEETVTAAADDLKDRVEAVAETAEDKLIALHLFIL